MHGLLHLTGGVYKQCSVRGWLFLLYPKRLVYLKEALLVFTNDLLGNPECLVRLFADDTLLYAKIDNDKDTIERGKRNSTIKMQN